MSRQYYYSHFTSPVIKGGGGPGVTIYQIALISRTTNHRQITLSGKLSLMKAHAPPVRSISRRRETNKTTSNTDIHTTTEAPKGYLTLLVQNFKMVVCSRIC